MRFAVRAFTRLVCVLLLLVASRDAAHAHGAREERVAELTSAIKRDPSSALLYLTRADVLRVHGEWDDALTDCRRARALDPAVRADVVEGRIWLDLGAPERALPLLSRAAVERPHDAGAALWLGRCLRALDAHDAAARAFAVAIERSEIAPAALYVECARAEMAAGHPHEHALETIDAALATRGLVPALLTLAVDIECARGRFDAALPRIDRAIDVHPASYRWHVRRGEVLEAAGRGVEARAAYRTAIETFESRTRQRGSVLSVRPASIERVSPERRPGAPFAPSPGTHEDAGALVEAGTSIRYLFNDDDPGIGMSWVMPEFGDSAWSEGTYPIGYGSPLVVTGVPAGVRSVYTRAAFVVSSPDTITHLQIGCDYDDGYVAWLNGVEIFRSPEIPGGSLSWDTVSASHESSNGAEPSYGPLIDVSSTGIPALVEGENVLAVGVWNRSATSSDLVLAPLLTTTPPPPITRGPYLQMATDTSVVVRWRTADPSDSRVSFGVAPGLWSGNVTVPGLRTEHEVEVGGLAPDASVYYAVGSSSTSMAGGDIDHVFETAPPPGVSRPTRLWVLGDSGTANANAAAVRDAYLAFSPLSAPDGIILLGDNAYESGTDAQYQAALFDMYPTLLRRSPLWPTLGNHDAASSDSPTESGPYYDMFTLPDSGQVGGVISGTEAYYSIDHGSIHLICLDSHDTDRSPEGMMVQWLEEDLLDTDAEWVIAFWHHPPYTKGSHDSDVEGRLVEMRENVLPVLEAGGVDLVLTGHSHSYERSFLIDGHYDVSSTFDSSMVVDGGDGRESGDGVYAKEGGAPHAGAVYVVAGSSGKISGGSLNHPAMFVSFNTLGSVVLDIDGSRLDAAFLSSSAQVLDTFTLTHEELVDTGPIGYIAPEPSRLASVRPNPIRRTSEITFDVSRTESVSLGVYSIGGERVRSLVNERLGAGRYVVDWDSRDGAGRSLPSGVYLVRLEVGSDVDQRKAVLVR